MMNEGSTVSKEEVKSSVTALSVARGFARAVLTGYDYLFDRHEAMLTNHLTDVGGKSLRGLTWMLGSTIAALPYSFQQSFFSLAVVPSYDQVIMLRKLMIKQKIEQAIANGVRQIVFLGSGYDPRGLVTALNHPDVHVYDIDRGPTRACKLEGLKQIPQGIGFDSVTLDEISPNLSRVNTNMHFLGADLSVEALDTVLTHAGYLRDESAVFIAEGLSMYLDETANRNLLNSVSALASESSELIISYGTASMHSQLSKMVQKTSNELYKFLLPMGNVIEFASASELAVTQIFSPAHALEDIGDSNAEHYKSNLNKPLEMYYTLKKQAINPEITINEVPVIKLELAEIPEKREESNNCTIL